MSQSAGFALSTLDEMAMELVEVFQDEGETSSPEQLTREIHEAAGIMPSRRAYNPDDLLLFNPWG